MSWLRAIQIYYLLTYLLTYIVYVCVIAYVTYDVNYNSLTSHVSNYFYCRIPPEVLLYDAECDPLAIA